MNEKSDHELDAAMLGLRTMAYCLSIAAHTDTVINKAEAENILRGVDRLLVQVGKLRAERDEWKRRAGSHGCDIEKGDADCG